MSADNTVTDNQLRDGECPHTSNLPSQTHHCFREHEPLTDILSLIPHKVQRGLKTQYEILELTALDANQYFIALGSNIGTVFLYDRAKHKIERLRSEDTTDIVTCVCLHHGLDDLVAIGHSSGTVYIFQLPSMLIGHSKQLERFIVSDVHQVGLTCLTWSTNGMKLFSGDKKGCVSCTEVDFYEGRCQSSVLLIEANTEIVQLNHCHKALLISTKHRCIVCRTDGVQHIAQVGSKERKVVGNFGASFIPAMCKPEDAQLYASRPGFRIWKASINGSVLNTFMFKELLSQSHIEIPVLDFEVTNIIKSENPNQFGQLLLFRDKELVAWNDSCLYVLDPENSSVIGSQKHIGIVKYVAVTDCEIFVLREGTDRNLIRISDRPITRPTSLLLKQLEIERQQKSQQKAESDKEEKIEKKSEQIEKSPFKKFQGNLFEKVKQIANPSALVDKVQEKLIIDKKTETIMLRERSGPSVERVSQEREDLPPVIQLDTPDLLTIEIGQLAIEDSSPEMISDSQTGAIGYDISVTSGNQSDLKRTGSGAFSALARLQEDHQNEEKSEPVYKIAGQAEETASSRISVDIEPEEEDGIVFRRKVKKNKKKGSKDKSPKKFNRKMIDPDSVSVNSNTSVASDSSENIPSTRLSTNEDSGRFSETSQQENLQQSVEEVVNQPVSLDPDVDNQQLKSEASEEISKETENVSEREYDEDVGPSAEDIKQTVNIDKEIEASGESVSVGSVSVSDSEQYTKSTEIQKEVVTTDFSLPIEDKSDNISNLDREMARLDSYLSQTSDTATDSMEQGTPSLEYKSEVDQLAYRTILGRSNSQKEKEILSTLQESDSKYTPSSLEKELNELEISTQETDSKTMEKEEETVSVPITTQFSPKSFGPNSTPSFYTIYSKPGATAEDFYSKYEPTSPSEMSSMTSDTETERKEDISWNSGTDQIAETTQFLKSVNTWTEISSQGNIHSLSVSKSHVWITDRSCNIFYSVLSGPGVSWKRAVGSASQISVSQDGFIVWSLNKNTVYAGTKITAKRPEGMKWVEAVRDVSFICVDNTSAWYIKTNHQVMIQKGLSRDRPCYTGQEVDCKHRLKQIVCQAGVVWALTENCHWLYRAGVTTECPEGKEWKSGDSGSENRLFSQLCLGEDNIGWAVDILGQVWFCQGVSMETPRGENHWWQVPLSGEYVIKDMTALDMLKSFSKKFDPQKLSLLLSAQSGGLIAARGGVWVCPEYKHILQVCRGSIEGQLWRDAHPESLAATFCWKTVVASTASQTNGVVWAQQPSSDIFAFSPDRQTCCSIPGPRKRGTGILFVCLSVCIDALWGLTDDGEVFIRTGMSDLESKGTGWSQLDLSQLDDRQLVHISCANMNVWAVDSDGMVWHRIGVKAPTDLSLNAAWLPVDNGETVFTQVVSCQQDWKVWAIDNRRQVYVRQGITQEMPIGRKWIHVSGSPAMQLTLSDNFVFALNHAGELLCRYGISPDHVTGDYWKKLPGELTHISATPTNILWGINKDGQLVRRFTKYIVRAANDPQETPGTHRSPRGQSVGSEDADWEFV
ncbi:tectonin beta-propeller repeat-containing protein 2-like isoform X2 [Mercenaria mercenaria]|uniref:tectonin beta-propeller repeat-containing protein 2-like isoform X2 n=1 Tax=Mercenaria mercenaria TaxID=6596 RepID=UPI00234F369A|nr:tectonin beta-propeller repeat-containing protein 2-like isoform X2 [Mercenaria mercenaria]